MRLDIALVDRGLVPTRSRALDLIRRGFVRVRGIVVTKAGHEVAADVDIALAAEAPRHVSRGAEKLIAALDAFGFDVQSGHAVDIGASTGGFTEVLLARAAKSVVAVDVGRAQLHPSLRSDPRVTVLEGRDARGLKAEDFATAPTAVTADVSFISLQKALPVIRNLAAPGAWLVALVKPQFEVGRDHVGKGGIVRDAVARVAAVDRIGDWLASRGWPVTGTVASPISGGDGNQEILIGARKAAKVLA